MELHREDVSLLDRAKIQSEVMIPLVRALERELGPDRAHAIVRDALAAEFRAMAQRWVQEADGDRMAAFGRFSAYSTGGDPLDIEVREAPHNELRFDVVRCEYARFFKEIGAPELGFLLVCSADGPIADGIGMGFSREQTIMQGNDHCDFHYIVEPDA
jgi:L-2-amino-thiazoline-4-carboxylic acid hydrolase